MKKFLFVAVMAALLMGTAVDATAKVKKTQKRKAQTTKVATSNQKAITSNQQTMKIDKGMYTHEGATRYANGDVADLEMAFVQDLYMQYVYTGNIYNEAYFPYVKIKFNDAALEQIKDAEGNYDWTILTGRKDDKIGVTPDNFFIRRHGEKGFMVTDGGDFKCYLKVEGPEGAYKITQVSAEEVKM